MKKFIALFLVISFLVMNCATYERGKGINLEPGQKPGVKLVIQKKNGQQLKGELIAVKQNLLLFKEYESGGDITLDVDDIKVIKIARKQEIVLGALIGSAIGGTIGLGLTVIPGALEKRSVEGPESIVGDLTPIYIFWGTILGALIGGAIGGFAGTYETIQIHGKSETEIKEILEDLRKKARVPNFQ